MSLDRSVVWSQMLTDLEEKHITRPPLSSIELKMVDVLKELTLQLRSMALHGLVSLSSEQVIDHHIHHIHPSHHSHYHSLRTTRRGCGGVRTRLPSWKRK